MNEPKVSVIIPFYNVENYMEECLDSVVNQTLKDIEIILVNDASTDKSLQKAQKYALKDKRIKIIKLKERKGQGFARNRALEIAKGKYIGFVDSDDFLEPEAFAILYEAAEKDTADITMCKVREYDEVNHKSLTSPYYDLSAMEKFGDRVFSPEETKDELFDINVALWNKIYNRKFLLETGEKFPEGYIYEDLPFFFGTYPKAKRIRIVWNTLYNYRINRTDSTMMQRNNKVLDRIPMVSLAYEKIQSFDYMKDEYKKLQAWVIDDLFHRYTLLKENCHEEFFNMMKNVFRNLKIENTEDDFWKTVYHFEGYLLVMNNDFKKFNQEAFVQYLDFHSLEKRLKSIIIKNMGELSAKLNPVYEEISKNYDFTKESDKAVSDVLSHETDEKISKVYDEITKNYEYTNKLNDEVKERLKEKVDGVSELFIKEIDEKLSFVYAEITKNYEYTNKLNDEVKEELKEKVDGFPDLFNREIEEKSSLIYDKISEIESNIHSEIQAEAEKGNRNTEEKISAINDEIVKNADFVKILKSDLESKIESFANSGIENTKNRINEINTLITNAEQNTDDKISSLTKRIEETADYVSGVINDFKSKTETETRNGIENTKNRINEVYTQLTEIEQNTDNKISSLTKRIEENVDCLARFENDLRTIIETETKNCLENTKKRINEIYTQITEVEQNSDEKISSLAKKSEENKDYISGIINDLKSTIENGTKNCLENTENRINEVYAQITNARENSDEKISSLEKKSEENKEYISGIINDLKSTIANETKNCIENTENRVKEVYAQITNARENSDEKISYLAKKSEENKNYISGIINDLKSTIENETRNCLENTENRVKEVYDSITEIYKYTDNSDNNTIKYVNDIAEKLLREKNETEQKINSAMYSAINSSVEKDNELFLKIAEDTERKFIPVYEKLEEFKKETENSVKEKFFSLYGDIKDLSYVLYDFKENTARTAEKNTKDTDEIKANFANIINKVEEKTSALETEIIKKKEEIDSALSVYSQKITTETERLEKEIFDLKSKIQEVEEKSKAETRKILEEVEISRKENIENLKKTIEAEINKFKESKKSPLLKLKEKFMRKTEKKNA